MNAGLSPISVIYYIPALPLGSCDSWASHLTFWPFANDRFGLGDYLRSLLTLKFCESANLEFLLPNFVVYFHKDI